MTKKELEHIIKIEIQRRIKALGLYATGNLYNSIRIEVIERPEFSIKIHAMDYYEYLDDDHNITDYVMDLPIVNDAIIDYLIALYLPD